MEHTRKFFTKIIFLLIPGCRAPENPIKVEKYTNGEKFSQSYEQTFFQKH